MVSISFEILVANPTYFNTSYTNRLNYCVVLSLELSISVHRRAQTKLNSWLQADLEQTTTNAPVPTTTTTTTNAPAPTTTTTTTNAPAPTTTTINASVPTATTTTTALRGS